MITAYVRQKPVNLFHGLFLFNNNLYKGSVKHAEILNIAVRTA